MLISKMTSVRTLTEDIDIHIPSLESYIFRQFSELCKRYDANLNQERFDEILKQEDERKSANIRFDLFASLEDGLE